MLTIGERDHLVVLYERHESIKTDLKDAIAAVAEKRGYQPATVRKYIVALVRDQAEQTREDAQHLLDLFDAEAEGLPSIEVEVFGKDAHPPARPKAELAEFSRGGQKYTGFIQ